MQAALHRRFEGRPRLSRSDDPAVDAMYDLPLGFEAYHAQILINLFSRYQLGVSYQDMDE